MFCRPIELIRSINGRRRHGEDKERNYTVKSENKFQLNYGRRPSWHLAKWFRSTVNVWRVMRTQTNPFAYRLFIAFISSRLEKCVWLFHLCFHANEIYAVNERTSAQFGELLGLSLRPIAMKISLEFKRKMETISLTHCEKSRAKPSRAEN